MPEKTITEPTLAERIRSQAAISARPGQLAELERIADEVEALQRAGRALGDIVRRLQDAALDATGLRHIIGEDGDGDWAAVWENVADLGAQVRRVTAQRDKAYAILNAIKAADPDLFDPAGGTSRGAAYETYGSPGHRLREAFCAAVGIDLAKVDVEEGSDV